MALRFQRWLPGLAVAALLSLAPGARADQLVIDNDPFADGANISNAFAGQGVLLSAVGGADANVYARDSFLDITGNNVFGHGGSSTFWNGLGAPDFRADFTTFLASEVSIDTQTDFGGTLTAFDAVGGILGSSTGFDTLTYTSGSDNIKSIVLSLTKGFGADSGVIDHLVITRGGAGVIPEPGSLALLAGPGLAALGLFRRRKA